MKGLIVIILVMNHILVMVFGSSEGISPDQQHELERDLEYLRVRQAGTFGEPMSPDEAQQYLEHLKKKYPGSDLENFGVPRSRTPDQPIFTPIDPPNQKQLYAEAQRKRVEDYNKQGSIRRFPR